jgi:GR25 family glycosyltransferase involved in LPS biosynthesis
MKIDHIYCINLERSIERREKMEREFGREGLDVEFFNACDGRAMGRDGVFGCAQSHINVWKDIVSKGYETALILEDDVFLENDFKKYLEVLEPPEKWDILHLGATSTILKNESEGHFTKCKTVGTFAYILNKNSVLKLAHIDSDDIEYDIDMYILAMPLKTWMCNKTLVTTLPPGIASDIGFRLSGSVLFYIHMVHYCRGLELLFILLLIVLYIRLKG